MTWRVDSHSYITQRRSGRFYICDRLLLEKFWHLLVTLNFALGYRALGGHLTPLLVIFTAGLGFPLPTEEPLVVGSWPLIVSTSWTDRATTGRCVIFSRLGFWSALPAHTGSKFLCYCDRSPYTSMTNSLNVRMTANREAEPSDSVLLGCHRIRHHDQVLAEGPRSNSHESLAVSPRYWLRNAMSDSFVPPAVPSAFDPTVAREGGPGSALLDRQSRPAFPVRALPEELWRASPCLVASGGRGWFSHLLSFLDPLEAFCDAPGGSVGQ